MMTMTMNSSSSSNSSNSSNSSSMIQTSSLLWMFFMVPAKTVRGLSLKRSCFATLTRNTTANQRTSTQQRSVSKETPHSYSIPMCLLTLTPHPHTHTGTLQLLFCCAKRTAETKANGENTDRACIFSCFHNCPKHAVLKETRVSVRRRVAQSEWRGRGQRGSRAHPSRRQSAQQRASQTQHLCCPSARRPEDGR